MPEQHITPEQQKAIARQLVPHAFDSHQALDHLNKLSEPLGLRFGHESMHHEDLAKNLGALSEAGHLDHHEVARVIQEVTGITTPPPKH